MVLLLCTYTALILSFILYLVYLRVFYLVRYTDAYTSFVININLYLIVLYVIAFVLSTWFTQVCYGAELTGTLLAAVVHDTSILDHPVDLTNYNGDSSTCDSQSVPQNQDNSSGSTSDQDSTPAIHDK